MSDWRKKAKNGNFINSNPSRYQNTKQELTTVAYHIDFKNGIAAAGKTIPSKYEVG